MNMNNSMRNMEADVMDDLWKRYQNTQVIADLYGVHERTVIRNLKKIGIHPPGKIELKEMTLREICEKWTPEIIDTAIWVERKRASIPGLPLFHDAVDYKTDERICVRAAFIGANGWLIDIRGVQTYSEYLLVLCMDETYKLKRAYYMPSGKLPGKKFLTIPKDGRDRIEPYRKHNIKLT